MRTLVLGVAVFFALAWAAQAAYPTTWTMLGDWGKPIKYASKIAKRSELSKSSFTLAIGDNFYENGVTSVNDKKFRTVFENVYNKHAFFRNHPFKVVAGNHDHRGSLSAQIAYTKKSKNWHFPSLYYKETLNLDNGDTADFIFIDTTPFAETAKKDKTQLAWFKKTLEESTATWIIVVGHHTIFSISGNYPYMVKVIAPLLEKHKVAAYLDGHHHTLQHHVKGNVNYLVVGNTGTIRPRPTHKSAGAGVKTKFRWGTASQLKKCKKTHSCYGFGIVSLRSKNTMSVAFYNSAGQRRYSATIKNPRA
jgi:predicted phosphodiesterase